jgi:hypothetical protein
MTAKLHKLDTIMTFGQYKGMTVAEVLEEDPQYLKWAYENIEWFDLEVSITDAIGKHPDDETADWSVDVYDFCD